MKKAVLIFLCLAVTVYAHELQGTLSHDGMASPIPRSTIPFDSSVKTDTGRVYTLWIAPDGAFVFYIEKPWAPVQLRTTGIDKRFRIWIVQARQQMILPDNFEKLDSEKKGQIDGAEELVGRIAVDWRGDTDYSIALDVSGLKKHYSFRGDLFGGSTNKPIIWETTMRLSARGDWSPSSFGCKMEQRDIPGGMKLPAK